MWFENSNQYLILENLTADIVSHLNENVSVNELAQRLEKELEIPYEKAVDFILDIEDKILKSHQKKKPFSFSAIHFNLPKSFDYIKQYQIHNKVFQIHYATEFELFLIHPKFSHLEVKSSSSDNLFYIFKEGTHISFVINNTLIGSWNKSEVHFLQGKVSMKIIEQIYEKKEDQWMGVFHASAIANENLSMLFLGDSGNGKSTSLALLQANGFTCMADDFVPVNNQQLVHSFPAAISIKKSSLDVLTPLYPSLKNTKEFHLKSLNKTVRYLASNSINFDTKLPCKALVFIKYDSTVDLEIKSIDKTEAFQQLIPDSWISPLAENVNLFLDWFLSLPCYQLTYSNNTKMIETVAKLFNDEL